MKSKVDPAFWRRFNALPLQVQQLARTGRRDRVQFIYRASLAQRE